MLLSLNANAWDVKSLWLRAMFAKMFRCGVDDMTLIRLMLSSLSGGDSKSAEDHVNYSKWRFCEEVSGI
jgi:hypothetical protein